MLIFFICFLIFGVVINSPMIFANGNDNETDSDNSGTGSVDSDNSGSGNSDNDLNASNSNSDDENDSDENNEKEKEQEEVKNQEKIREEYKKTFTNNLGQKIEVKREVKVENGKTKIKIEKKITDANGNEKEIKIEIEMEDNQTKKIKFESETENESVEIENEIEIEDEVVGNEHKIKAKISNGNSTEIKITPNQIAEVIRERLRIQNKSEYKIKLEEKTRNNIPRVVYNVETNHHGEFLGIFKLSMKLNTEVDPGTGEILEVHTPWWAFLVPQIQEAKSEIENQSVNSS